LAADLPGRKTHTAAAAAREVSGTVRNKQKPAFSLGRGPSPRSRTCTLAGSHTTIRSPSLPFNCLRPRNACINMDYYSFTDPRRMEGWVGLVGWPTADSLPTCQPQIGSNVKGSVTLGDRLTQRGRYLWDGSHPVGSRGEDPI